MRFCVLLTLLACSAPPPVETPPSAPDESAPPVADHAEPAAPTAAAAPLRPSRTSDDATAPPPQAEAAPTTPPEPPPPPDNATIHTAPDKFDHLVLKISFPVGLQYDNIRYEGHNGLIMKGAADGEAAALRWRKLAAGTRGVFVLRDSMWSQQDHPYQKLPYALMMPPSWVTAALVDGADMKAPIAPATDAEWTAIKTPQDMFGSFPPSDSLHREAIIALSGQTDADQKRRTAAARASLASLRADVLAMKSARDIAQAGAERISRSDVKYFGRAIRYHRIIPIFVENPNTKELEQEGKGMHPLGRKKVDPALIDRAMRAVYRRRLLDGPIAIERYDLSQSKERDRAIAVLEALIPPNEEGPALWLWVTGRLDPHRKAEGENATKYLPVFRKQIAAAKINLRRLRILSKPSTQLPDSDRQTAFLRDAKWYRMRALPYSVRLSSRDFSQLIR